MLAINNVLITVWLVTEAKQYKQSTVQQRLFFKPA